VVKEFRRKIESHVVPLLKNEGSLSLHAVIDAEMIPFAAYIAAESTNAFQWAGQPPKLSLPVGDLDSI